MTTEHADGGTGQLARSRPSHLALVRFRQGDTQASLARRAGVARTTVSELECGVRRPTLATALAITRALLGPDADVRAVFPDFSASSPPIAVGDEEAATVRPPAGRGTDTSSPAGLNYDQEV